MWDENINNLKLNSYGEGDNSVTDRMFYEDAARICQRLITLQAPLNSRMVVEYVRGEIEKIVKKNE